MAEENTAVAQTVCCGGPAAKETDACCVKDAVAKEAGEMGCGCGAPRSAEDSRPAAATASCCG